MINVTKHPDKVMAAVVAPISEYFMVVDIETGMPQHFSVNRIRKESLGEFIDAEFDDKVKYPAGIYDRETALYLIGQSAISSLLNIEPDINNGEKMKNYINYQPSHILIPVSGSCLPATSPSNPAS